jgi:hypothetical protein
MFGLVATLCCAGVLWLRLGAGQLEAIVCACV